MDFYFIDELRGFANNQVDKLNGGKALRVWNKCMLHGHPAIAQKIKEKYEHKFPKCDISMAFGWALMAKKATQI